MPSAQLDLNLLTALDALLAEGSVSGAAGRLHLSVPAMSRTLGRIRRALGDPVLVRAGHRMVPTPRALAIQARVRALVAEAQSLLVQEGGPGLAELRRTFTVRANDAMVSEFGAALLDRVHAEAPEVTVRFVPEGRENPAELRDGMVDIEIGIIRDTAPEITVEPLAEDVFLSVVRAAHPLATGRVTAARYARAAHVVVSRHGRPRDQIDELLAAQGLTRTVLGTAPTYPAALFMVRGTDLVTAVPGRLARHAADAMGLHTFPIPVELPPVVYSQAWHPRLDRDPAHSWLRGCIREVLADQSRNDTSVP